MTIPQDKSDQDPREHAFTLLTGNPTLSIRHLAELVGISKEAAQRYKNEYLRQAGLNTVSVRSTRRRQQEQDAAERISQVANITDPATIERIAGVLHHLYVDWANDQRREQADDITERLESLGVSVNIAHYTGDSSYPTEYTISHPRAGAVGPTFDLALIGWIERLVALANQGGEPFAKGLRASYRLDPLKEGNLELVQEIRFPLTHADMSFLIAFIGAARQERTQARHQEADPFKFDYDQERGELERFALTFGARTIHMANATAYRLMDALKSHIDGQEQLAQEER